MHWLPELLNKCLMWVRSLNSNARKVQNRKSLHLIRNNCWGEIDLFSVWVKIRYRILPSFSLLDPQIGGTQHTDNHKLRKFWFYTLRLVQSTESLPCWKAALCLLTEATHICFKVTLTLANGKDNFTCRFWFPSTLRWRHVSSIWKMWFCSPEMDWEVRVH